MIKIISSLVVSIVCFLFLFCLILSTSAILGEYRPGVCTVWTYNYDVKYIDGCPCFTKNILTFFNELKKTLLVRRNARYGPIQQQRNSSRRKPVFIKKWFDRNILTIKDMLNSNGQLMSFQEFINKYDCNTNFM